MKNKALDIVSFDIKPDDVPIVRAIAKRAVNMALEGGDDYPLQDAMMDIQACHANGNPLKLLKLLDADDQNFSHDVFGIKAYLDRETGQLRHFFRPRFSV